MPEPTPMAGKSGQFGLRGLMAYPVLADTEETYKVGPGFALPEAQEFASDPDITEGDIYADDQIYYHAREEKGSSITMTLAELTLALRAMVENGEYDPTLKRYTFPKGTPRPTLAIRSISPFIDNSGYAIAYAAVVDILSVEMAGNKTTRADGVEINPVNIVGYSRFRKVDGVRVVEYMVNSEAEKDAAEADFIKGIDLTETP